MTKLEAELKLSLLHAELMRLADALDGTQPGELARCSARILRLARVEDERGDKRIANDVD